MTIDENGTLAAMQVLLAAKVPVVLWGDPGTGKTQTIERLAANAGWHIETVIASLQALVFFDRTSRPISADCLSLRMEK